MSYNPIIRKHLKAKLMALQAHPRARHLRREFRILWRNRFLPMEQARQLAR